LLTMKQTFHLTQNICNVPGEKIFISARMSCEWGALKVWAIFQICRGCPALESPPEPAKKWNQLDNITRRTRGSARQVNALWLRLPLPLLLRVWPDLAWKLCCHVIKWLMIIPTNCVRLRFWVLGSDPPYSGGQICAWKYVNAF